MNPLLIILLDAILGLDEKSVSHRSHTGITPMIRAFNSFQLVTLFAALPYILGWLNTNPFPYSPAAYWTAIAAYLVLFIVMCVGVFELAEK